MVENVDPSIKKGDDKSILSKSNVKLKYRHKGIVKFVNDVVINI